MPPPINTLSGSEFGFPEGISSVRETLTPYLDEDKVLRVIGNRVDDGIAFWKKTYDLSNTRENNEKRWLNQNLEVQGSSLYDFQTPYRDNRIFLSVETLASQVVGRIPYPEVTEGQDTEASRELAHQYEKILFKFAEDNFVHAKLQMVVRHLLIGYRLGAMKIAWNPYGGMINENGEHLGDVYVNFVRPHRLVLDAEAYDSENIPLIAESCNTTLEELGFLYPDKKDKLYAKVAGKQGGKVPILSSRIDYHEVWFTFFDDNGNKGEAVAFKYENLLLDYGLNPNYNYETQGAKSNFFDSPRKPYVLFNFLQLGKWAMDDTSLTEQAATLQDVLEKRGRQIVDSADQAAATRIFNTMQINARDAEKYVGNPRQNILVKGDVRTAFARFPAPELPRYVLEDKYDASREIDNIFGTHAPIRGEKTESPTLGQEVLSQRTDLGRLQPLSEGLEKGGTQVYQHITQLYKVYATEVHIRKYAGDDGSTVFTEFSSDKIEDGIQIRVRAGSLKVEDKLSDRNEAIELAKIGGRIDPLTFAEKWHTERPREFAKRLVYFLVDPQRYIQEILEIGGAGGDKDAMAVIQRLQAGENVPPKEDASKEYVAYFSQFLKSLAFKQLDQEVKQLIIAHVRGTIEASKGGLKQPQQPSFFSRLFQGGQAQSQLGAELPTEEQTGSV